MAGTHTSRDFESELRELRANSLAMGARCERSLRLALEAFWGGSSELAQEVKDLDRIIDRDEMEIDALVLRILALRQPVAYDLRVLATALKLVTDLERIGDEAVNIAERSEEALGTAKNLARADLKAMVSCCLPSWVEGCAPALRRRRWRSAPRCARSWRRGRRG